MLTDWEKGLQENASITYANECAYINTLDKRYRIEVQRIKPYEGMLKVFDHEKDNKEIFSKNVDIYYDARFGPDAQDVYDWDEEVIKFIDNEYSTK